MTKKLDAPEPPRSGPSRTLKLQSASMPSADFGIVRFLTIEQTEKAKQAFLKQRAALRAQSDVPVPAKPKEAS